MNGNIHIPVLVEEVMNYLDVKRKGIYVDCTLGLGGHAVEILKRNPDARLIGFDIDEKSLLKAKEKLEPYADRVELYHSDFRYLPDLNIDFSSIIGILLDLGISSFQLDSPERGFSFNQEGPLDMRMDLRNKVTASKIVNKYSEYRLVQIFKEYGELKQAKRLAREIVSRRKTKKIETTTQLRRLVEEICRWRPQKGKIHPAAKLFQAIRIELNQELKSLSSFLERISKKIPKKAHIIAISFHSLEDRIIKHTFAHLAASNDSPPSLKILTKKPVIPSDKEVAINFRARSAKLRAVEKI
ncbi:MAG: 16S rRNA (cytosine(1402)-N(4))-methyltransferase RsmH [Candidatus Aminicenantes bacterium]|nr:16S rRNA (cytosine(1402)-N(4))-methyltransferase RsmH [Candidatus Aminicenantes bacterium]MCK4431068.1 16S rRNA (cytosine(1402)-N(4))-methyltransferase RsmH [Candidatus Aminicenantes bacterium]